VEAAGEHIPLHPVLTEFQTLIDSDPQALVRSTLATANTTA
jgi:hypothetical protein